MDGRVEKLLKKIVRSSQKAFGENLVGVYLHGSLAFGCFRWNTGDVDFLVVVQESPDLEQKEAFMRELLVLEPEAPPKGLEMSVLRKAVCSPFLYPTPFELHYSKVHREACRKDLVAYCRSMQGTDRDLAAHCTVLRAVGHTLYGKPKEEVFAAVPEEEYLDSIRRDVEHAEEDWEQNPVYCVLNLCRVLAYQQEGQVLSKEEGTLWGLQSLPEQFTPLLRAAGEAYRGAAFSVEREAVVAFVRYMVRMVFGFPVGSEE